MQKLSEILRAISLSILFGGSAMVVFVAVVLVKSQTAQGIPVSEAAANNAPAFIQYAKVLTGASVTLLIAEGLGFFSAKIKNTALYARIATSMLCVICGFVFSFVFVKPMAAIQPLMKTDEAKAAQFHDLHEKSRIVFGAAIIFALLSILIPIIKNPGEASRPKAIES